MTFEYFIAYFFVLFLATIILGPNSLLAINHGAKHGIGKIIYSALGNLIGNLLLALVSILGLGAILLASSVVFAIIKWIGIAYLIYIGIKLIIEPITTLESINMNDKLTAKRGRAKLFIDGFFIAVGNPKGVLFFTALFPQFIDINSSTVSGFFIVFITLGVVAFGCYMLYAIFGVKLSLLFKKLSIRKGFNRITGSIFIGTGLLLTFSEK